MLNRILILLSTLATLVAVATAAPAAQTKLVVWGVMMSEESAGQRAMVAEFEKRNPDIKVSILSMGAGNMNPQKLMTAIVGKTPPDLVQQDRFTIGDWASRDTFMDLSALIKRDCNTPDGVRPEEYYVPCWQEATYKGKVYAIPNSTDARFLYYNKTMFKNAGLDPERPPQTWEELLAYSKILTKKNASGGISQIGFIPNWGNSYLYMYSWQNGGEFMSADGRKCTMDNKYSVEALKFMVGIYDALGGANQVDRFQSGFQGKTLDPFLTGKVAMKIDVDNAGAVIARFNPDLNFGVAPAPVPLERTLQTAQNADFSKGSAAEAIPLDQWEKIKNNAQRKGRFNGEARYITWSGGFSWAIPVGARNVEASWRFIKWMNSPEANLVMCKAQKEYNLSKNRPYIPTMHANIKVNEAMFAEYAPKMPKFRNALKTALSLMPYSKYRPVTFVGQMLWDEHVRAFDQAIHHEETKLSPQAAMTKGTQKVQRELDRAFAKEKTPVIPVWTLWVAIIGVIGALAATIGIMAKRSFSVGKLGRSEALAGYAFASPWIIGFLVFTIGPIVASIVFSFCDYDVLHAPRWVGISNYAGLLTYDWELLSKALYNAAFLAIIGLPLGIMTGLAIAMLLNTNVTGMTWYRTLYYLPSIVPIVASAVLWLWVLNPSYGIVNSIWQATLTQWFGLQPPGWLAQPGEFFGIVSWVWKNTLSHLGLALPSFLAQPAAYLGAKSALITMGLWGAGGGMIIWLAGLKGIPVSYYEAADLDGASQWQKFKNITLPMISPYLFFNLIMGTIGVIQTFDNVYVMTGGQGGPVDATVVPMLYLFNKAFTYFSMGYASALAWIMFAIILVITVVQLKVAPRWVHYEAEKGK